MEAGDPFFGVFATGGNPVGIDLALQILGVGEVVEVLEPRLVAEFFEFEGVIVVRQHLSRSAHLRTGQVETSGHRRDFCKRLWLDMWVRVRGVDGAERAETVDDLLGFFDDRFTVFMRGADDQAFAIADAFDFEFSDGTDATDLDGSVSDGFNFFRSDGEVGCGFAEVTEGVELAGDLGEFHDFFLQIAYLAKDDENSPLFTLEALGALAALVCFCSYFELATSFL